MELYLLFLSVGYIYGINSQFINCGTHNEQVVNICTNEVIFADSIVYVSSENIPRYQQTHCSCWINARHSGQVYYFLSFVNNMVPNSLSFKINNNELNSQGVNVGSKNRSNVLTVVTSEMYNGKGACLNISSDKPFHINCTKTEIGSSSNESATPQSTTDLNNMHIIIPVVASIIAIICLVVTLLLIIYCKRRSAQRNKKPEITKSDVTEKDDDYYMTENPMYETGDNPKHLDNSEHDYHYVENDKQNNNRKHFHEKQSKEDHHYDYSACLSSSEKTNPTVEKDITKAIPANVDLHDIENTYDKTSAIASHRFQGPNEYHHLGNVGSRKRAAEDTYNTISHTGRSVGHGDSDDLSNYSVTNGQL